MEELKQHELILLKAKAFDAMQEMKRLEAEHQQKQAELQGLIAEIRGKENGNAE